MSPVSGFSLSYLCNINQGSLEEIKILIELKTTFTYESNAQEDSMISVAFGTVYIRENCDSVI